MTANRPPAGNVINQERNMFRIIFKFSEDIPRAKPTPNTDPTNVCVVEIGSPNLEAMTMVVAAPNSAEKPLVGVNSVIFLPMVSMTRQPHVDNPTTIPMPPNPRIHNGTGTVIRTFPDFMTEIMAAIGPIAFATSLAPCANATKQALNICKNTKTRSTTS